MGPVFLIACAIVLISIIALGLGYYYGRYK
jgi:hypothetical protein